MKSINIHHVDDCIDVNYQEVNLYILDHNIRNCIHCYCWWKNNCGKFIKRMINKPHQSNWGTAFSFTRHMWCHSLVNYEAVFNMWQSDHFEYRHQIAQFEEYLTIDSGGSGSNASLVRDYFSQSVTNWLHRWTPAKGRAWGDPRGQRSYKRGGTRLSDRY